MEAGYGEVHLQFNWGSSPVPGATEPGSGTTEPETTAPAQAEADCTTEGGVHTPAPRDLQEAPPPVDLGPWHRAAGHELQTIQETWPLATWVLPGANRGPRIAEHPQSRSRSPRSESPSLSTTWWDRDAHDPVPVWCGDGCPHEPIGSPLPLAPTRSSVAASEGGRDRVQYLLQQVRSPAGTYLNERGYPVPTNPPPVPQEAQPPQRQYGSSSSRLIARWRGYESAPVTRLPSPRAIKREREEEPQIQVREFAHGPFDAEVERLRRTPPPQWSHSGGATSPANWTTSAAASGHTAASSTGAGTNNGHNGYAHVPGTNGYADDGLFGTNGNVPHASFRNEIFTPIGRAMLNAARSGADIDTCHHLINTDVLGRWPTRIWRATFRTEPADIASVRPTLFRDQLDNDGLPRLDLVAFLSDGETIRYHFRDDLVLSWRTTLVARQTNLHPWTRFR